MFFNKNSENQYSQSNVSGNNIPSVIAPDLIIMGNIVSDGSIENSGKIQGNIKCQNFNLRSTGLVKGDIIAEQVRICGEFHGTIKAKNVIIAETGKIVGNIFYESLSISDGAYIDGQFRCTVEGTNAIAYTDSTFESDNIINIAEANPSTKFIKKDNNTSS